MTCLGKHLVLAGPLERDWTVGTRQLWIGLVGDNSL